MDRVGSAAPQAAAAVYKQHRGLGALLGIATGLLADRRLQDEESVPGQWLWNNSAIGTAWPADVIHGRIKAVLADGQITEDERIHLVDSLQQLVGGTLSELANETHETRLLPYETPSISYPGSAFCPTGDFVFGPRSICKETICDLGDLIKSSVSKKVNYLVVGGLGSPEWEHGSFGTKVEREMELKNDGIDVAIVHEDYWADSLPRGA